MSEFARGEASTSCPGLNGHYNLWALQREASPRRGLSRPAEEPWVWSLTACRARSHVAQAPH